jgi:hypothetical protein
MTEKPETLKPFNPDSIDKNNKLPQRTAVIVAVVGLALLGHQIFGENNKSENDLEDPRSRAFNVQALNMEENVNDQSVAKTHESFEVPAVDQRILPGSRVQVVETGGDGLNIRTEAGINSNLVKNVPDGTVFKVVELAGEKDGYNWILVKSEGDGSIGYVATDWLQVLKDGPIQ